jgi:hypothetical protein
VATLREGAVSLKDRAFKILRRSDTKSVPKAVNDSAPTDKEEKLPEETVSLKVEEKQVEKIDSIRDRTIVKPKEEEEEEAPVGHENEISTEKDDSAKLEESASSVLEKSTGFNAKTQKADSHYWYKATDIKNIVNSSAISTELERFHFLQPQQAEHLQIDEVLPIVNQGKAVFCIHNVGNMHWTTFCLMKKPDGKLVALYKDSLGDEDKKLTNLLKKQSIEVKCHRGREQSGDGSHCGVFALRNMCIMAGELRRDSQAFIQNFENQAFCTLKEAQKWRPTYADYYSDGKRRFENMAVEAEIDMLTLTDLFQEWLEPQLDQVITDLKENIPEGMTLLKGDAEDEKKAKRTIFVRVGPEDNEWTDYHFRISVTKDITPDELQEIINQKWMEGDYRREGRVFKVTKKYELPSES